jgi:hypothetical protein
MHDWIEVELNEDKKLAIFRFLPHETQEDMSLVLDEKCFIQLLESGNNEDQKLLYDLYKTKYQVLCYDFKGEFYIIEITKNSFISKGIIHIDDLSSVEGWFC